MYNLTKKIAKLCVKITGCDNSTLHVPKTRIFIGRAGMYGGPESEDRGDFVLR